MSDKEYIERASLLKSLKTFAPEHYTPLVDLLITKEPAANVVEVVGEFPQDMEKVKAIFISRGEGKPPCEYVPVVRCKNCKHYSFAQSLQRYECNIFNGAYNFIGYPTEPDDFCSYGEPKDEVKNG